MGAISLSSIKNLASQAGNMSSGQSSGNSSSGGLADTASSYLGNAGSDIASGLTSAENYVGGLLGDGEQAVQSSIGSIADAVGNKVSSLFNGSDNSKTAALNTKTSDPLKTSTVSGTPKSTTFTTNSQYAQTQPINLQNTTSSSKTSAGFGTILSRVKGAANSSKDSIFGIANGLTHNSVVSSLYKTTQDAVSGVSDVVSGVETGVSDATSTVTSIFNDFTSQYSNTINSLGTSPSSIKSLISSGLHVTADANGNAVQGVPTNISAGKLKALYGMARSIGCSIDDVGYTSYGAEQTMKGLLLGVTSRLNMTNLFRQMTNCTKFQDARSISSLSGIFTNSATQHPGIANIASEVVNDPTKTPISHDLAKSMVTNKNLTASDSSDLTAIFNRMGVSSQSVYGVPLGGTTTPVYDSDTLAASPKSISTALLGSNKIADMVNDIPLA